MTAEIYSLFLVMGLLTVAAGIIEIAMWWSRRRVRRELAAMVRHLEEVGKRQEQ